MASEKYLVSEFDLLGQLQYFLFKKDGQIKYLKLSCDGREYLIKLTKSLRYNFPQTITPGCWLTVKGEQKQYIKTGKLKLKASIVELAEARQSHNQPELALKNISLNNCSKSAEPSAKVLVCKKSSCWKRGGQAVCQLIEDICRDRDWGDRVEVKTTGCLKQCKQGPNVVMLPSKTRYSNVKPQQVPVLLEKHLLASAK